jgi:hypothetical protein
MTLHEETKSRINEMLDLIQSLKEKRGIKQKGGKLYTVVADRVEALRRVSGDYYSIQTELVHYEPSQPDSPVLVKATIRDPEGRVIVTGHAEEWRSKSYVNQTSAVENAETSAIGRALAALGLHGGEYASANEIDIAEAKREHLKAAPPKAVEVAVPTPAGDAVIEVPNEKQSETLFVDVVRTFLPECNTVKDLTNFWTANSGPLADLKASDPQSFATIKDMFTARKAQLKE